VVAERQFGVRPVLDSDEADLAEPRGLARRERRGTYVDERGATPQAQGVGQALRRRGGIARGQRRAAVGGEPLEPVQVGVVGAGGQAVPGRVELDGVRVAQRPPQPRHL
jgi:hypothetical protein